MDEHHLRADVGRVLEQRPRARDAAEQQRHLVGADHLEPGRRELRPALDLEQRVRVGDDLVPAGHAHSLWRCAIRSTPGVRASGYPVGARGVAQPGSALRSGRRGPQFESGHPDSPADAGIPRGDPGSRHPSRLRSRLSRIARGSAAYARSVLRAVLFDVDFTLSRPGPELGPEAYRQRRGRRTGSSSTRSATRTRASRHSPTCARIPSSSTTRRSGSRSRRTSCAGWAATPDGARACAVEIVRRWEIHANFDLYDDAVPALEAMRAPRAPDRPDLERPARPRGVRPPPPARRRRRRRLEEPRPHEAARLDLRERPGGARRRGGRRR